VNSRFWDEISKYKPHLHTEATAVHLCIAYYKSINKNSYSTLYIAVIQISFYCYMNCKTEFETVKSLMQLI